jgi:hypothetical protein
MIEIGTRCKINLSETEYVITDVRRKSITVKLDENTTHQMIDYLVDLKEIENHNITVENISITNISTF